MPKETSHFICLSVMLINSVFEIGKNLLSREVFRRM